MLDKKGVPLYVQLKEKLLVDIRKNYKENELIPTESELEKRYKVSRITVRKAIEELQREHIVEKKQGLGTFVKKQKISYDANFVGSLTQRLASQNRNLSTQDMSFKLITKEHFTKDLLRCSSVLCLKRLRLLDGVPFALMFNYLDASRVENMQEDFKGGSLYGFLKQAYDLEICSAEETIEAMLASKKQALMLGIKKGFPLLSLKRLSFDEKGKSLEFSKLIIRADMYQHKVSLAKKE